MVHFCIPFNNLNGCTAERKFGEKSVLFFPKTFFFCSSSKIGGGGGVLLKKTFFFSFFFWSSPKIGEKKCSISEEDHFFFFWSLPEIGKKKCSISEEDLFFIFYFFWSSSEFGEKKCSVCIFRLVFTKFPHLNKIVVEVHPPNVENRAKMG